MTGSHLPDDTAIPSVLFLFSTAVFVKLDPLRIGKISFCTAIIVPFKFHGRSSAELEGYNDGDWRVQFVRGRKRMQAMGRWTRGSLVGFRSPDFETRLISRLESIDCPRSGRKKLSKIDAAFYMLPGRPEIMFHFLSRVSDWWRQLSSASIRRREGNS